MNTKNFENKEISNLKHPDGVNFTYVDFALSTLNSPLREGMTVDDVDKRVKLMDKFRGVKIGGTISLTQEGYDLLLSCTENMKWGFVHDSIPDYDEYIKSLGEEETPLVEEDNTEAMVEEPTTEA